jgi:hypothetical protein
MREEQHHYKRICESCGHVWGGLHCPHDGYQNCCPECGQRPKPVDGDCDCEFDYEGKRKSPVRGLVFAGVTALANGGMEG